MPRAALRSAMQYFGLANRDYPNITLRFSDLIDMRGTCQGEGLPPLGKNDKLSYTFFTNPGKYAAILGLMRARRKQESSLTLFHFRKPPLF